MADQMSNTTVVVVLEGSSVGIQQESEQDSTQTVQTSTKAGHFSLICYSIQNMSFYAHLTFIILQLDQEYY